MAVSTRDRLSSSFMAEKLRIRDVNDKLDELMTEPELGFGTWDIYKV